jgi:hypothetical protein
MIFGSSVEKVGSPESNAEISTSYSGQEAFISLKCSHDGANLNAEPGFLFAC